MTGGDRCLERVRAQPAAELLGTLERRETTTDEDVIPAPAVLIEQQDGLSRRADPRAQARRLDLQQRHEAVDLRLPGSQLGQDAAEAERVLAERRSNPVVTGGRRVALI